MPEGVEVRAELQDGIVLATVDIENLREQDINARVMDDEMFGQLVANIKKRGALEQLPYCAVTNRGVEIVSGHHRVRAANIAGLKQLDVLLDTSGLTRSAIAAKQLAHNAIEGTDDPRVLKVIAALITDVDDMLESAIDPKVFAELDKKSVSLPSLRVNFDYKNIQFTFLDEQLTDLKNLCENLKKQDFIGVADVKSFDEFAKAISATKKAADTRNVSSTIWAMIKAANEKYGDFGEEGAVSLAQLFGRGAIPEKTAEKVTLLLKNLTESGEISNNWEIFDLIAEEYCNGKTD